MNEEEKFTPKEDGETVIELSASRGGLLTGALVTVAILYALSDRGPWQYLQSAALLGLPFGLAALAGGVVAWIREKRGAPTPQQVRKIAAIVASVGVIGGIIYYGLFVAVVDSLRWLLGGKFEPGTGGALLVASAAAAVGAALFWVRLKLRLVYGVSEVIAGLSIAAWRGFSEASAGVPSSPEFYFAILTASIYLVVRGADNVHQALQANTDSTLRFFKRFLSGGGIKMTIRKLD